MRIDSIKNGIVIDHIAAGKAKEVYDALDLGKLDCQVAIIMNCRSNKMGKNCLLYTSPSPRDISGSRMPSSA